ncbi:MULTISPECIES: BBE domain-containing protein [Streptomyces]|uniref:BBE domain-containing protein n=1 Tax=Streptomyces TaxID=1883 RepID=UPI002E7BB669|nr:BBE domain-containing protein [Streptomyces huasconensis]
MARCGSQYAVVEIQVAHSYGPNTERLLAVKSAVDPDFVFAATPLPVGNAYAGSMPG